MTTDPTMQYALKPSEARPVLVECIKAQIAVILKGSPGIGKSAIINQICAEELGGIECIDWLRASQMDAVDTRGAPDMLHSTTKLSWLAPDWLPMDPDWKGVVFLDELGQGTESVQASMMQFVLERRAGQHTLPPGGAIIAATNLETDRAGVHKMLSALNLRFTHITLVPDVDDYCKRMLQTHAVDYKTLAFIRWRPHLLHQFDPKAPSSPNPRSWERVSKLAGMGFNTQQLAAVVAGTVGPGAAIEYMAFLDIQAHLPNLDAILANPHNAAVPDRPDVRFCVAGGLARKATHRNIGAVLTYAERMGEDIGVALYKDMTTIDPHLANTDAATEWCVRNSELLS